MKQFFNKILETFKTVFSDGFDKHQRYLTIGTLLFGVLCGFVFGPILTIILMVLFGWFAEFCYCFVPTKTITFYGKEIKFPNLKLFFANSTGYMLVPKHELKLSNFYYIIVSILIFLVLKILF